MIRCTVGLGLRLKDQNPDRNLNKLSINWHKNEFKTIFFLFSSAIFGLRSVYRHFFLPNRNAWLDAKHVHTLYTQIHAHYQVTGGYHLFYGNHWLSVHTPYIYSILIRSNEQKKTERIGFWFQCSDLCVLAAIRSRRYTMYNVFTKRLNHRNHIVGITLTCTTLRRISRWKKRKQ